MNMDSLINFIKRFYNTSNDENTKGMYETFGASNIYLNTYEYENEWWDIVCAQKVKYVNNNLKSKFR